MREKGLGVLALQETHLTKEHVKNIDSLFGKRLTLFHSEDPNEPSRARGVAIVLNKEKTNIKGATATDLIPGRALLVTLPWHKTLTLKILAIYAPNSPNENRNFWESLTNKWQALNITRPDIMLGDFNMVEDGIDRVPHSDRDINTAPALQQFRIPMGLRDGWREMNPSTKDYTFMDYQAQSRLDRIYATNSVIRNAAEWNITNTPIPTDHKMVSVQVIDRKTPFIGKGRWTIPPYILEDPDLQKEIQKLGRDLEQKLKPTQPRTAQHNPQVLFQTFKEQVHNAAKERTKTKTPKITQRISTLETKLGQIQQSPNYHDDQNAQSLAREIQEKITSLMKEKAKSHKDKIAARYRLEGEINSKYWSSLNKEKKPRDIIYALKDPDDANKETNRSDNMARIARNFYNNLQMDGLEVNSEERETVMTELLNKIHTEPTTQQRDNLKSKIQKWEVDQIIAKVENGRATGMDGIPYELWKMLSKKYKDATKIGKPAFDIIDVLTKVYNDIEEHGVDDNTNFSEGWICPIYKKKDNTEITNYRPITLLNSDYKILTKCIATRLLTTAPTIIHPNQAGFVPGRSIADQVRLSKMIIDYAEVVEENGIIVALDQEKAYDRFRHDYLWKVLEAFKIPEELIQTIRNLYKNAKSIVIVNGVKSEPFAITRGVRQGDAMSCPLSIMAIEPLIEALRASNLKGFDIPGIPERIISTLFADDTTVYLSEEDEFDDLTSILDQWCLAAGSKFNKEKTEVIPIGTKEFRTNLIQSRRTGPQQRLIPDTIHIAKEGEAVRSLGAWIGNGIDQHAPWTTVLDKIARALKRWKQCNPTLKGKQLIVQMVIGGMTQYLTSVQGMPKDVEKTLMKTISEFIWAEKRPAINGDILQLPIKEGGLGILNLKARNEAITLMKLKAYLDLSPNRPAWAYVADILIGEAVTRQSRGVHKLAKINIFLQSWSINMQGNSRLNNDLLKMLRTGQKYGARFDALRLSTKLKRSLPAWYHIGTKNEFKHLNNAESSKCLREKHEARTTGDLIKIQRRITKTNTHHKNKKNCLCIDCVEDRHEKGCLNPRLCANMAQKVLKGLSPKFNSTTKTHHDGLSLTRHRKKRNARRAERNESITFDPSVTTKGHLAAGFRIFTTGEMNRTNAAIREQRGVQINQEALTMYTEGFGQNNGSDDARVGAGVWVKPNHRLNKAIRVPPPYTTSHAGDLFAILIATQTAPNFAPLHIRSTSKLCIKQLTKNLPGIIEKGYIGLPNPELLQTVVAALQQRSATTTLKWVQKNEHTEATRKAKQEAKEGAQKDTPDNINLSIRPEFKLTGAQMSCMTQALAYKGIRERTKVTMRRTTRTNLDKIKQSLKETDGRRPSDEMIWKSIRHKDITRKVSDFLWNVTHGTYKCGAYWENIPNFESRAKCKRCGQTESMEHILTECNTGPQNLVWNLTESLWRKKYPTWQKPTVGSIMGAGKTQLGKWLGVTKKPHAARLYRILITEGAHLIWKLRCEWTIQLSGDPSKSHSEPEIVNRWLYIINDRLTMDRLMTSHKYKTRALSKDLVLRTWSGLLENEDWLPDDWIKERGVLVGIRARR